MKVSIFVGVVCVISALVAMTAKETKALTLDEIDALHTARGEAADLAAAGKSAGKTASKASEAQLAAQ